MAQEALYPKFRQLLSDSSIDELIFVQWLLREGIRRPDGSLEHYVLLPIYESFQQVDRTSDADREHAAEALRQATRLTELRQAFPGLDEMLLETLVKDLGLTPRVQNVLARAKILTVRQLMLHKNIDRVCNFGVTARRDVELALREIGLTLDF